MPNIADGGSQLPLFHIVGFTGHRHVESPELIAKAIDSALQFLQQTPGEWVALASVAEGCDQLFREAGPAPRAVVACHPAHARGGVLARLHAREME